MLWRGPRAADYFALCVACFGQLACGRLGYELVSVGDASVETSDPRPAAVASDGATPPGAASVADAPATRDSPVPGLAPDDTAGIPLSPDASGAIDQVPPTVPTDTPGPDAPTVADLPAGPIGNYIGPNGLDTNPGTAALPWKTWSYALSRLDPGRTLVVLDGDYGPTTGAGVLHVGCATTNTTCRGAPCRHGSASQRIRVVAQNERRARLLGPSPNRGILEIEECRYWTFEGLHVQDGDNRASGYAVVLLDSALDIDLRRLVVRKSNRYKNSALIIIQQSENILVEESEFYEGHRDGFRVWFSTNVVLRRNYINGGGYADIPGGQASSYSCPGDTDTGIYLWGSAGGIVENNVLEGPCRGVAVTTTNTDPLPVGAGDNARILGNVAFANAETAYGVNSNCDNTRPCTADNRVVSSPLFDNNVSFDSKEGFESQGALLVAVRHHTVLRPTLTGFSLWRSSANAGLMPSATITDSLVVGLGAGTTFGFSVSAHLPWTVDHCNAFATGTNYSPLDANVVASLQVNPMLGPCRVEIPTGSPLKGAGTGGGDIGATIRRRYQDGVLGSTPLWDPGTGAFPCGAVVPGVNDEATFPARSCSTVHSRIGVAVGCGR